MAENSTTTANNENEGSSHLWKLGVVGIILAVFTIIFIYHDWFAGIVLDFLTWVSPSFNTYRFQMTH